MPDFFFTQFRKNKAARGFDKSIKTQYPIIGIKVEKINGQYVTIKVIAPQKSNTPHIIHIPLTHTIVV